MNIQDIDKKYNSPGGIKLPEVVPRSEVLDIVEDVRTLLREVERLKRELHQEKNAEIAPRKPGSRCYPWSSCR